MAFSVACGGASNRLTTVILASTFPVLFFPVMGSVMWGKNATRHNVNQLRDDGYHVIEPVWHENFDASLQQIVGHPSLPDIETVISLLKQHLPE
ncbi:flavoprotein [Xenorhabdus anantnagensis]|uniref:Flavoprotein n=1 Tax=Xenorhabdus anantnagensis TaxID=3025875 RepID=A0ABT5LNQ1_9GAMM|nr:flavoprotein [Xenorhabdus anantnagensis]MDC9596042.1 flavoprotein [Xenorhabdus anantnagensis]